MTTEEVLSAVHESLEQIMNVYSMNMDEDEMTVPYELETLIKINPFEDFTGDELIQGLTLYFADQAVIRIIAQRIK